MVKGMISVVVPFRNVKPYLFDSLKSIQDQTYSNIEVILLDDDSNDGSEIIAQEFAKTDSRFKYHRLPKQKNISCTRNLGKNMATGEFLSWVDGDDIVSKDFLKILHSAITSGDYQMSTCKFLKTKNRKARLKEYNENFKKRERSAVEMQKMCLSFKKIGGYATIKMFKTELAQKVDFCDSVSVCEDLIFVIQYLELCDKVILTNEKTYLYFQRSGSLCHSYDLKRTLSFVKSMNILVKISSQKKYFVHALCWRAIMTLTPLWLSKKALKRPKGKTLKMLFGKYFEIAKKEIKKNKQEKTDFIIKFVIWFFCLYYGLSIKKANKFLKKTKEQS